MTSDKKRFVLQYGDNAPSLHRQLVSGLAAEFAELPPGTALPSTVDLKKRFNVAYMTITRALDELVVRGDIVRFQGKGTFTAAKSNAPIYYFIHCPLELKVERNPILDGAIAQAELSGGKIRLIPLTQSNIQGDVNFDSVKTVPCGASVLLDSISNYRYILEYLIRRECRIALVNSRPEYYQDWQKFLQKIHNIYYLRQECVMQAVKLLSERKRKNIFLVHEGPTWNNPIRKAFREGLAKYNRSFNPDNELYATDKPGQCRARMMTLQHRLDKIDGIITVYPHHALEIYKLLKERSRNVPEDVSLISLQDSPLLAANTVGITAFDFNLFECGRQAVKLLYSTQVQPQEKYVDYIYRERNSI